MAARMLEQENQRTGETKPIEIKTGSEKKTRRLPRYWVNRVQEDDSANIEPEEIAATLSSCEICKKDIEFKGLCENHCAKGCNGKSRTFCKEDCSKECCENSKSANKSENLCSPKCGTDCCVDSTIACSECLCSGSCKHPTKPYEMFLCSGNRAISGVSEEDLTKDGSSKNFQMKKRFNNVLEEMKEKFNKASERSEQQEDKDAEEIAGKKEPTYFEDLGETLNKSKDMKEAAEDDEKDLSDKGMDVFKSWWNSKFPSRGNQNPQDDDSKEKSGNSSDRNSRTGSNPSEKIQVINRHEESCLRRAFRYIIQFFVSMFHALIGLNNENQEDSYRNRMINFFYRLFNWDRSETEQMSTPELPGGYLSNPEVTALIPPALRRRNPPRKK